MENLQIALVFAKNVNMFMNISVYIYSLYYSFCMSLVKKA